MSSATTYFGNRATCKVLNTWSAVTVTMTNASATFSGGSCSAGDYVWITVDGIWNACKVVNSTTLAYPYLGTGGSTQPGYKCTPEVLQVLRGLELNLSYQVAELYGTDDIRRVDEAKYQFKAETKARYSKWDCGVTVDWMNNVLKPAGGDGTTDNTNTCFVNGVVYTVKGTSGDYMEFVCGKTYWKDVPYPFPENDFIIRDITGTAQSITAHKL